MRHLSLLVCASLLLGGCSLFPDKSKAKLLNSGNHRMYYEELFEERCVKISAPVAPTSCLDAKLALDHWKKWLALTTAAFNLNGAIDLHLSLLKDDEAKVKKGIPK